jgi:hypothetical protein
MKRICFIVFCIFSFPFSSYAFSDVSMGVMEGFISAYEEKRRIAHEMALEEQKRQNEFEYQKALIEKHHELEMERSRYEIERIQQIKKDQSDDYSKNVRFLVELYAENLNESQKSMLYFSIISNNIPIEAINKDFVEKYQNRFLK